jgi:hypothetical protein
MFKAVGVLTIMSVLLLVAGCGDDEYSQLPRSRSGAEMMDSRSKGTEAQGKGRVAGHEYQDAEHIAASGDIKAGLRNDPKTFGVTKTVYSKDEAEAAIDSLGGRWRKGKRRLEFADRRITDAQLQYVKWLNPLEQLSLSQTYITDAGLVHLKVHTWLSKLDLSHTQITDAGLEHVRGFVRLRSLSLAGTQISDAGLEDLTGLSELTTLDISGTQITDEGLKHLRKLTKLRQLKLTDTLTSHAAREELKAALPEWRIQ